MGPHHRFLNRERMKPALRTSLTILFFVFAGCDDPAAPEETTGIALLTQRDRDEHAELVRIRLSDGGIIDRVPISGLAAVAFTHDDLYAVANPWFVQGAARVQLTARLSELDPGSLAPLWEERLDSIAARAGVTLPRPVRAGRMAWTHIDPYDRRLFVTLAPTDSTPGGVVAIDPEGPTLTGYAQGHEINSLIALDPRLDGIAAIGLGDVAGGTATLVAYGPDLEIIDVEPITARFHPFRAPKVVAHAPFGAIPVYLGGEYEVQLYDPRAREVVAWEKTPGYAWSWAPNSDGLYVGHTSSGLQQPPVFTVYTVQLARGGSFTAGRPGGHVAVNAQIVWDRYLVMNLLGGEGTHIRSEGATVYDLRGAESWPLSDEWVRILSVMQWPPR